MRLKRAREVSRSNRTSLKRIVRGIVLVGVALILIWTVAPKAYWTKEPVFQGRPLSQWLVDLGSTGLAEDEQSRRDAEQAIRQIGTNSFPYFLHTLQGRSSLGSMAASWMHNHQIKSHVFLTSQERLAGVILGIRILGATAEPLLPYLELEFNGPDRERADEAGYAMSKIPQALPYLLRTIAHSVPERRVKALEVLGEFGTNAAAAVPMLWTNVTSQDAEVRAATLLVLGNVRGPADMTVPLLINGLRDPHWGCRMNAEFALRNYPNPGRDAILALTEALGDTHSMVQDVAETTLDMLGESAETLPKERKTMWMP